MTRRRPDPSELSVREARDRYLRRRRPDSTEQSSSGWEYRLKLFVERCESVGIETVGELRRYDVDEYYELRSAEGAPATLEGEMWTLKMFCDFLEDLGAIEDGISDAVRIPDPDPDARSNDVKLATEDAKALLRYYRDSEPFPDGDYGTRGHAFLELAWWTGARIGGLRAFDLRDTHLGENPYVDFRHRPETGTPLKNKMGGERPVAITDEMAEVIDHDVESDRYDIRDDHGRQPLLASKQGRPAGGDTVRVWSYLATLPCKHGPCPHGKEPPTCQWTEYAHASKCPSSRSLHAIRTGAIT